MLLPENLLKTFEHSISLQYYASTLRWCITLKKKTTLIPYLLLLGILLINPIIMPAISMHLEKAGTLTPLISMTSPIPPTAADWIDVTLDAEYTFDNDSVTISWSGRPRTNAQSPFNPLYNWTKAGYIDGGIGGGNPGNATIYAVAWDNTTTATEVRDFLNYTMVNYVRYAGYPSLSNFNFTQYENQTEWLFNDGIALHEEFLNTTFYLVNNATAYLMNGFNVTGIIAGLTAYHIHLEWFENDPIADVAFTYTMANIIEHQDDISIFRLGRALGRTTALNLTGEGQLTIHGPYNRVYLDGSPDLAFEDISFPYYPIGIEEYSFTTSSQEFDYTISFQEGTSALTINREFSITELNRGNLLTATITVVNTGNTYFSTLAVRDVIAIETGIFKLISGVASKTVTNLQPGENVTFEYTAMALVTGIYEYPAVQAIGTDVFYGQSTFAGTTESITVSNGLTPDEVNLIVLSIAAVVIIIIILILYRFRRRIF
jgi:hypothetical protein